MKVILMSIQSKHLVKPKQLAETLHKLSLNDLWVLKGEQL